jgi:hypothetical protein
MSKQKKEVDKQVELLKEFKKPKCTISKSAARSIVERPCDTMACLWIERWIEQLVRENSYPPQLKSNDFVSALSKFLTAKDAIAILERIRRDYAALYLMERNTIDVDGLIDIMRADEKVVEFLPLNYLYPK